MFPSNTHLAEQLAEVLRETADIRRLCKQQRKELAVQFDRLQTIRRGLRYTETSLQASRNELWESRLLLIELHSGRYHH